MRGLSTFILLTCGLVSIQAYRRSSMNANMNTNVNSLRRNYNRNMNANALNRDSYRYPYLPMQRRPIYSDEAADGAIVTPYQGDEKIDALANTAGNAALTITKKLADDMGESVSIAIADAVARILTSRIRRTPRDSIGRRNSNFNSNFNLNIVGHAGLQNPADRQPNVDENASRPEESADGTNADSGPLRFLAAQHGSKEYMTGNEGSWKDGRSNKLTPVYVEYEPASRTAEINAGILRDDEKTEDGEELPPLPAETAVVPEDMVQQGEDTPVPEQPPTASRSWGNSNVNSNVNMNNFEPSGHRRNFNGNSKQNMFRRNLNANSNTNLNSYRRSNVNYNSNSNRMDPHPYYHQY